MDAFAGGGPQQVGYTPERTKVAVLELDPLYDAPKTARVLHITPDGEYKEAFRGEIKPWGKWMRYQYAHFDFSFVREPGVYAIEYAGHINGPFRVATFPTCRRLGCSPSSSRTETTGPTIHLFLAA
jgi:hypothetical protein